MKRLTAVLFLLFAFLFTFGSSTSAQLAPVVPKPNFHETLSKATFALYGRYPTGNSLKPFVSRFHCTATVIDRPSQFTYILLTAGHCIEPEPRPGMAYFVAETVSDDPVLQSVRVLKFADTKRYDYAILMLNSPRDYPVIDVDFGALPPVETQVVNVNFGLAMTKQLVKGFVGSGIISREEQAGGIRGSAGRFMVEFGIAPGASGSAIVDENSHKIIGIVEAIFPGLANGTVAMPMCSNFDDFGVDGSVDQKPLPPKPHAVVAPAKPLTFVQKLWRLPLNPRQSALGLALVFLGIVLLLIRKLARRFGF